ncbi:Nose resistant to fluoxetine protein 6, partial [Operophtera brumata]
MSVSFTLAMCIPKPCTTELALSSLFFNVSAIGFQYTDIFCRLSDDKPWSPADTVATVIFSVIGILTVLSTSYDLVHKFMLQNDPKLSHPLYTSFSVYTNGRRLMTFTTTPMTLHCLDGIRALAMAWVVVGHSFSTEVALANPIYSFT